LTPEEQVVVDSYKVYLWKIAYNKFPRFRHVGQRCDELNKMARTFMTGWPFEKAGNNQLGRLGRLGREQLVRCAEMYEKRLRDLYKAKHDRDVGRIEH